MLQDKVHTGAFNYIILNIYYYVLYCGNNELHKLRRYDKIIALITVARQDFSMVVAKHGKLKLDTYRNKFSFI